MDTHVVTNQPPPLVDYDLYASDPVFQTAVAAEGGNWGNSQIAEFGRRITSAEVYAWASSANRHEPVLHTHDRYGNRSDTVEFHPAWHQLMETSVNAGLHSLPWERSTPPGGHVVRTALFSMMNQIESGHTCPISMTSSVVPALRLQADLAQVWEPAITSRAYDARFAPAPGKTGILFGMGMTEKQGGSDVRANTTSATPVNGGGPGGEYRITGHKWFTSAPMCDAFLVLAQAPGGLSCFLLPRFLPDGTQNVFRLQRLKDKLGNRSNASSEVEFEDSAAWMVGDEGRGVPTIIEMVNGTRLDVASGSIGLMRQAVTQAGWHAVHRAAFGSKLIDKPLMQNVLADLEIEVEAATLMTLRLAGAFDRAELDEGEAAFKRIATPIAKYWVTKRCTPVVREAMECLGGNGYVEDSILPRLFRESPLNAIWEGSGNVIALDVLRSVAKAPGSVEAFRSELKQVSAEDPRLDAAVDALDEILMGPDPEPNARRIVERLAVVWAACLLVRAGRDESAAAFIASRVSGNGGSLFGTLPPGVDTAGLARDTIPKL
jgi:putative acyl-CoA dehydrogenase